MCTTAVLPLRAVSLASAAALHDLLDRTGSAHHAWGTGKTKSVSDLEEEVLTRRESRLCWVDDPDAEEAFGPILVRDIHRTVALNVERERGGNKELLHEFLVRDDALFSELKRLGPERVPAAVRVAVETGRLSPRGYGSGLSEKSLPRESLSATVKRMCREELGISVTSTDLAPHRFQILPRDAHPPEEPSLDLSGKSLLESFLNVHGIRRSNSFPGLWTRNANLVHAVWHMPLRLQQNVYLAERRYVSFWKRDDVVPE